MATQQDDIGVLLTKKIGCKGQTNTAKAARDQVGSSVGVDRRILLGQGARDKTALKPSRAAQGRLG